MVARWEDYRVELAYDPYCIQDVNNYEAITDLLARLYLEKNKVKTHDFHFQYCHMGSMSSEDDNLYLPCVMIEIKPDENWEPVRTILWKYKLKSLKSRTNKNKDIILFSPFCEWEMAEFWESGVYYE